MKRGLVETVKLCFTGEVISQLSSLVDETEPGVERALNKSVPLVLNGMLGQAGQSRAPAALLTLVREADAAEVLTQLPEVKSANWHERGTNLLLDLLGTTYRKTVNQIAEDAGVRPSASGTLLQVAATAVLGVLGKFAAENELTPLEFVHWLQSQKEAIGAALLPPAAAPDALAAAGSEVARRPAATPPRRVAAPMGPAAPETAPAPDAFVDAARRWQWGLLLLVAVGLGYGFGRSDSDHSPPPVAGPAAAAAATTPPPAAPVSVAPASPPAPFIAAAPVKLPPAAPAPVSTAPPAVIPKALVERAAEELLALKERRATAARTPGATPDGYSTGKAPRPALAAGNAPETGSGSTETRLYRFLANPAVRVDSVNRTRGWIDFDRVSFEPGQTTLTPESRAQLAGIARVLQTFPNAVVKIGGYTDSTGVGPHDLQFSEARARAVMTALSEQGVRLHRLFAQGYGAKYAVAPNSTEANRAQNRRVSIRVLRK